MRTAVVVRRLDDLYLVGADGAVAFAAPIAVTARRPAELERALREVGPGVELRADAVERVALLASAGAPRVALASVAELRAARRRLPRPVPATERRYLLTVGRAELERVLASPEEVLISLAREEERLERAVGREARAAEAFLAPEGSPLREYVAAWATVRAALEQHHAALAQRTRSQAEQVVPNLAALVGPGVAARLVAAAGGVSALGRMRASRLQLLGSRRRPSPDRGPRYGLIYRADRMAEVPADRRGAYARSLASLASIAIRADAATRRDLSRTLRARRDRRVERLRRQGR